MSRKDTILRAAKRTAKEARAAASSRRGKNRAKIGVEPHRHCVVCWTPVPLEEEPPRSVRHGIIRHDINSFKPRTARTCTDADDTKCRA